jgi:hypothetical protein
MKRPIFVVLLLFCAFVSPNTSAQITSNVFERVLDIRVNAGTDHEGTATAFTLDVDGREYLITAKHVVQGLKDKDRIDIFKDDRWTPIAVDILRCEDPVDIAVLIPPYQLTINFELPFEKFSITFGGDAYFLGFSYGIRAPSNGVNGPYPLALIKRGTLSGQVPVGPTNMILLDGYNNPGFSGGPIVFHDSNRPGYVMDVIGVISGFIPDVVPTMKQHDIKSPADASKEAKMQPWKVQQRSDGTYFEYVENGSYVALNTGIVRGFFIQPAIDLIRLHPIGPPARDLPGNNPVASR